MRILVLVALVLGASCSDERSARCRDVCQQGEQCAEEAEDEDPTYKFDEGECTAACAFLEQDAKGAEIVETYVACVKAAGGDCAKIRACD